MDPETKTLAQWEIEKQCVIRGVNDEDAQQILTEEQFDTIRPELKCGCDVEFRTQWLADNGYAVTRENLLNNELGARQTNLWS